MINLDASAESRSRRPTAGATEVIRRLENAALQRNPGEFSRMIERALGLSHVLAERITRDPSGEPVLVAARALGMPPPVLQRILLVLNPEVGQSIARVYALTRLYHELTSAAAEQMLTIWRKASGTVQTAHAPLYWNDERRDARSAATPARYRSDRRRIVEPTRVKKNEA